MNEPTDLRAGLVQFQPPDEEPDKPCSQRRSLAESRSDVRAHRIALHLASMPGAKPGQELARPAGRLVMVRVRRLGRKETRYRLPLLEWLLPADCPQQPFQVPA